MLERVQKYFFCYALHFFLRLSKNILLLGAPISLNFLFIYFFFSFSVVKKKKGVLKQI